MVNGISKPRMGHLTAVPKKSMLAIKPPVPKTITRNDLPAGFQVFQMISFSACKLLRQENNRKLLEKAVNVFKERAKDPKFLSGFAEAIRMGGINTVFFKFALHEEENATYLHARGTVVLKFDFVKQGEAHQMHIKKTDELTPPMETEVLLLRVKG